MIERVAGEHTGFVVGVLCKCLRLVPKCCLLIVAAGIKLLVQIINTNRKKPLSSPLLIPILISPVAE